MISIYLSELVVTRESDDRLTRRRWEFNLGRSNGETVLVPTKFLEETRPSRRHKYRESGEWQRHSRRNDMESGDVPFPEDVGREALERLAESARRAVETLKVEGPVSSGRGMSFVNTEFK